MPEATAQTKLRTCAVRRLRTWSRELGSFVAHSLFIVAPIASVFFCVFGSSFIMQYLVYFLVLQFHLLPELSRLGRERWSLYFKCSCKG